MKVVIYDPGSSAALLFGMLLLCIFMLGQKICFVVYSSSADIRNKIVRKEKFLDHRTSVNFLVVCINFGGDIWKPWL